jgi:hypothetical protein
LVLKELSVQVNREERLQSLQWQLVTTGAENALLTLISQWHSQPEDTLLADSMTVVTWLRQQLVF